MAETTNFNGRKRQFVIPKSSNSVDEDGLSECYQVFSTKLYVSLSPSHIGSPINGLKSQHLDPLVMSYFPKAKGVILAYFNIKLSPENESVDTDDRPIKLAKISASSPFTFLWITVDFLVWRPQIGDILEGNCYMQTASHIGLLVHDTFNASIKKYNIPNSWNFVPSQLDEYGNDEEETTTTGTTEGENNTENGSSNSSQRTFKSLGYWEDENNLKMEGKIKFTIKNIYITNNLISIDGTLIKPEDERENQPIYSGSKTLSNQQFQSSHKKFDDVDDNETMNSSFSAPPLNKKTVFADDDTNEPQLPHYDANNESDAENGIINNSDDSE